MSTFAFPTDTESDELAANMDTFVGKNIALQALSPNTVPISTTFGPSPALRVKVIDLDSGEMTSPHLLFWSKVQEQVLSTHNSGVDWAIGRIENVPQQGDPTRSVYLIRSNSELVLADVGTTIAKAEAEGIYVTEEATF